MPMIAIETVAAVQHMVKNRILETRDVAKTLNLVRRIFSDQKIMLCVV